MRLSKGKNLILGLVICLGIYIIGYVKGRNLENRIQADMQMTSGRVVESSMSHRGGVTIRYIFYYNNIEYEGQETMGIYSGLRGVFLNKYFPVVFSDGHPKYNDMLLLPRDFER